MLKFIQFSCFILIIRIVYVDLILAKPTPTINLTNPSDLRSPSNYVEIKLPVRIKTVPELVNWIKNAMQTMASKIDITLASPNESKILPGTLSTFKDIKYKNGKTPLKDKNNSPLPRNSYVDDESPWLREENEMPSPLAHADAFLPLIIGDGGLIFPIRNLKTLEHIDDFEKNYTTVTNEKIQVPKYSSNSESSELSSDSVDIKKMNVTRKPLGQLPFTLPFEAYITLTRESLEDNQNPHQNQQQHQQQLTPETRYPPDDFPPYSEKKSAALKNEKESTINNIKSPVRNEIDENPRKRQFAVLGDLLQLLNRNSTTKLKIQEAATMPTIATLKPTNKSREEFSPQLSFDFDDDDDQPLKPQTNETSQRQESDEDSDEQGLLGTIADLLPLAIPILEDLSDPNSDTDLIEVLQAGIPLIQGFLEPDEDGTGGAQDIINTIVPIIEKIVKGLEAKGVDLGELVGPIFNIAAPFIGPFTAPLIGPLIRLISNPPNEGSSLPALITAIVGPLATPEHPSWMSPLSNIIAGTSAGIFKELKIGAPGGLDVGGLTGAILTGVLTGAFEGLSILSGKHGHEKGRGNGQGYGYGPKETLQDLKAPALEETVNTGFSRRPSPGSPVNSPFNIIRTNHPSTTVNIGSTIRPSTSNYPTRQSNYVQPYAKPGPSSYVQPKPQFHYSHLNGPIPAAATSGNGGSTYLPSYGSNAVPANSVNPLSLITMSVKDILGAGIQVVSSLVNAVFGILGASSMEKPKPSYGPPAAAPYNYASG